MATNGSGNGRSSFDALLSESGEELPDSCNRMIGDVVALRIALRFLLESGAIDGRIAEQIADGFSKGQADIERQWLAAIERKGLWAVARYRSFAETTNEIINGLRAVGRRGW